jgi:hypothetical protein
MDDAMYTQTKVADDVDGFCRKHGIRNGGRILGVCRCLFARFGLSENIA